MPDDSRAWLVEAATAEEWSPETLAGIHARLDELRIEIEQRDDGHIWIRNDHQRELVGREQEMPVLVAIQRLLDDEGERREQKKKEDAEVERGSRRLGREVRPSAVAGGGSVTGTELLEARTGEYPREDAVELHDAWPVPGDRPRPRFDPVSAQCRRR